MWKIKRETLQSIILAARKTHPDEFISLLGGDKEKKLIDELVVVPAQFGEGYSWIYSNTIPFDGRIVGSVHSHPSPYAHPSIHDLQSFPKFGEFHIIIAHPYTAETVKAYDNAGKKRSLHVV